jgi:hypothetical protein
MRITLLASPTARMIQVIGQFIGQGLVEYAAGAHQGDDPLVRLYQQHRVRYEIAIVLPDAQTRRCC